MTRKDTFTENDRRAQLGRSALAAYISKADVADRVIALRDLLADLMHATHADAADDVEPFDTALRCARMHFSAEVGQWDEARTWAAAWATRTKAAKEVRRLLKETS